MTPPLARLVSGQGSVPSPPRSSAINRAGLLDPRLFTHTHIHTHTHTHTLTHSPHPHTDTLWSERTILGCQQVFSWPLSHEWTLSLPREEVCVRVCVCVLVIEVTFWVCEVKACAEAERWKQIQAVG